MGNVVSSLAGQVHYGRELEELGRDFGNRKLRDQLEKISDKEVNWFQRLGPAVTYFQELARTSDAHTFRVEISYSDRFRNRKHCHGTFEITGQTLATMPIEEVGKILLLELEQACGHGIVFMLEEYGTTYDQEWHAVNTRRMAQVEAEGRAAFQADLKFPHSSVRRGKGVLKRKHAPWRISR